MSDAHPAGKSKLRLSRESVHAMLRDMMRIRHFETKCAQLYTQEKIRGFLHLYDGEEAIAVGVTAALEAEDRVVSTYREHGHALARGVSMSHALAEMYGKANGCSGGRGGSMHLFDREHNFYGGNAIVGGGLPLATGLALGDSMLKAPHITVCFFGEGAAAEGEFHEALNLAALWSLPVLFVCENNRYAMGTDMARVQSVTSVRDRAAAYGIQAERIDGMDVVAVESASRAAVAAMREQARPHLLECITYRFRAHSMFDAQLYRDKEEVAEWREKGPIVTFQKWLLDSGLIHEDEIAAIEAEVEQEISDAVQFAEEGPWEPVDSLRRHVVADSRPKPPEPSVPSGRTATITYRDAMRESIMEAMLEDERVFLMGEDVGAYGGCFAVSKGLMAEFGEDRIRDAPLSESGFTGAGIGASLTGMRPIVELMTVNFSLLALDQIVNTAATLRHMSGGQFGVPLVIRMATGAGKQLAAQHSHSLEGWYTHIPGLRILAPATVEDARGMLLTALREPDPVLIFENVILYNHKAELDENAGAVDIERAAIRRRGKDLSLITYGGSLYKVMEAAEQLANEGIEAEVIDLRVLRPLDDETLMDSVRRTRRAVVVDEGWRTGSLAAEISARITEQCFWYLDAPVGRVCSEEVPIPYARHLEVASIPQVPGIVAAARAVMGERA